MPAPTWTGTLAGIFLAPPSAACILINLPDLLRWLIGGAP